MKRVFHFIVTATNFKNFFRKSICWEAGKNASGKGRIYLTVFSKLLNLNLLRVGIEML